MTLKKYIEKRVKEELGNQVEVNPRTGNLRLVMGYNAVMKAIEGLGGVEKAATLLKIPELEIENWIDEHYVPSPYDMKVLELLGFESGNSGVEIKTEPVVVNGIMTIAPDYIFVESLQESVVGFHNEGFYWPYSHYLHDRRSHAIAMSRGYMGRLL